MRFRLAEISDIEKLNKISFASKAYWGYPSGWIEKWKTDLAVTKDHFKTQHIIILEAEDKIIGFSSMQEHKKYYEILHLWVLPEFIGNGYGRRLLHEIINRYAVKAKPIQVEADPNAEKFYEKHGFKTVDKLESYPKGRFLPVMKKTDYE